jgi:hypothetical protein
MGKFLPNGTICVGCGKHKPRLELRLNKRGQIKERICLPCRLARTRSRLHNKSADRLIHKKSYCDRCGFRGEPCQLDVDHIDGNHANNTARNYQTLCANCHRLKSFQNKEVSEEAVSA